MSHADHSGERSGIKVAANRHEPAPLPTADERKLRDGAVTNAREPDSRERGAIGGKPRANESIMRDGAVGSARAEEKNVRLVTVIGGVRAHERNVRREAARQEQATAVENGCGRENWVGEL